MEESMRGRGVKIIVMLFCLTLISTPGFATEYTHETSVDKMTFSWKVADENLHVKLSAKTQGWVGIGFNPEEKMKGADYVLGYVKKGEVKLRDDYGDSARAHKADKKLGGEDNVTVVGGEEAGGVTTVEFSIPLNSGDKYDTVITPDGETVVLLAYGGKRDSFTSKHKYRGAITVNLATGKVQ